MEYFISYYDYYQPEAFIPSSNTYIEKDASINDEIDRLRLRATSSLLARQDVIVVASVSCIFGLGNPENFRRQVIALSAGMEIERDKLLHELVMIHYTRNDVSFTRGTFRVRGDVVEIRPAYEEDIIRVEFFGDEIERIAVVDPITSSVKSRIDSYTIFPASLFVTERDKMQGVVDEIGKELEDRLSYYESLGRVLEAQRLESRTRYDMEMLLELGYCSGVENYSRYFDGRRPGQRPACLLDYFPDEWLLVIDESHVTVSQVGAMYNGDRARKETLVEHGFRLPSALDNRPLKFEEFQQMQPPTVYVSATPGDYELECSGGVVVEQLIRPTGLMDPELIVRKVEGQIDDLMKEVAATVKQGYRILVTTLTKRMAEDLTDYLSQNGVRVQYLHSDIAALDRVEILRGLRLGEFDVLVGINLLREGLDLPEVGLVAILDADKEGFLRSERSLIQTAGRAARNVDGRVILYADKVTGSMERALAETARRREIQRRYNEENGIIPKSISKSKEDILSATRAADSTREGLGGEEDHGEGLLSHLEGLTAAEMVEELTREMFKAAKDLDFEAAAVLRDRIDELRLQQELAGPSSIQKERERKSKKRGKKSSSRETR